MQQTDSSSSGLTAVAVRSLVWIFPIYALVPRFGLWGPLGIDDLIPVAVVFLCTLALLHCLRPLPGTGWLATVKGFVKAHVWAELRTTPALWGLIGVAVVASLTAVIDANGTVAAAIGILRVTVRLSVYCVLLLAGRHLLSPARRRQLLVALVAIAVVEGLFGLGAYVFRVHGPWQTGMLAYPPELIPEGGRVRVQGTFGGQVPNGESFLNRANFYSAYLVVGLMALANFWAERRRLWLVIIAATAIIAGILVSYSRMSLAAALVGFLLAALLAKRWIGAGLAAAMVALVVTASGPLRDRFFELDTDRVGQWTIALRVIASHFWLGAGDGRYLEVAIKVADGIAVPLVRTPHNSLLYAAATYGIFAGVALAVLYVMLVVEAVQRVRRCASPLAITRLTLVAAFLVHDVTNNLFFIPEVALMFWAVYAATEEPAAEEPAAKEPVTDAAVRPHR